MCVCFCLFFFFAFKFFYLVWVYIVVIVVVGVNNSENSNREHIVSTRFSVQYWIPILQFYMNWELKLVLARWLAGGLFTFSWTHFNCIFVECISVCIVLCLSCFFIYTFFLMQCSCTHSSACLLEIKELSCSLFITHALYKKFLSFALSLYLTNSYWCFFLHFVSASAKLTSTVLFCFVLFYFSKSFFLFCFHFYFPPTFIASFVVIRLFLLNMCSVSFIFHVLLLDNVFL